MLVKKIFKKIIIKLCRICGYEIIDQNQFTFPSLKNRKFNKLSIINKKSVVIPLGEVKISRKIEKLSIIIRTNTNVHISDQNKKRIFNRDKREYIERSLNSLVVSINSFKKKFNKFKIDLTIIDQSDNEKISLKFDEIFSKLDFKPIIIAFNKNELKSEISVDFDKDVFGNLSSLLKCFKIGKESDSDLIFFLEDDYLHKNTLIEEMILTYERISSQTNRDLILVPSDYPFLYMEDRSTNILAGSHRHWQTLDKILCSFMVSKKMLEIYWNNFLSTCTSHNKPIEKHLNEICKKEICLSPIPSLSLHVANSNSIFGISPYIDIEKEWEKNKN